MDNKKKNKGSHGRHSAEALSSNGGGGPQDAGFQPAPKDSVLPSPKGVVEGVRLPMSPQPAVALPSPVAPGSSWQGGALPGEPTGIPYGAQGFIPANPLPSTGDGAEGSRSRRPLKIVGIVLAVLVGLLLVAYIAGGIYFTGRFMPNTTLGQHDVSLKTAGEVQDYLSAELSDYSVSVSGQGFSMKLSASDAGITLDGEGITKSMLSDTNPWLWPLEITRSHDETEKLAASYNESGLATAVRAAVDEFNATATQPTDATIAFSTAADAYTVQTEAVGTVLDADAVIEVVDEAVVSLQPIAKLTEDALLQPTVLSTNTSLRSAADSANQMIKANMQLAMGGTVVGSVTPELVSSWVRLGDDLSATLDESALTAWVEGLVSSCSTVGTSRTYTRPDGKVITVSGGVYGWSVDRDALLTAVKEGVSAGTVATVDVPCTTTGTAYNGAGVRDWSARYCDIDLSEQHVRFYDESGALIWESDCISGTPDGTHDTSTGVYWVNQKASPSKLIGYENGKKIYESTVQYWMPFVGNAIGLHDADWQPDFGGTMYREGYGSHGCVNLPPSLAASLYGIIRSGDVVVCHW